MADVEDKSLPILGILGLGSFGRLMVEHLSSHFRLYGFDPAKAKGDAHECVTLADLPTVANCPIVALAIPVNEYGATIAAIRPHLRPGTLVLDVGSVKAVPAAIMKRDLPDHVDIVATHPLFGPKSVREGIAGLKIVVCPLRGRRGPQVAAFLRKALGLRVIVTTPEAHDREAATVQGLTHLIAKLLLGMGPLPTQMTTPSFDTLLRAVEMVRHDAPEVFQAIERANPYSYDVRKRFLRLAVELDASLAQFVGEGP